MAGGVEFDTRIIPVTAFDGEVVYVEATLQSSGVAATKESGLTFNDLQDLIRTLTQSVEAAVKTAKPSKVTVEFGVKVAAGTGGAVKWVVDVKGEASLTIGLEWT